MQRGTKPGMALGDQDGQRASASPQGGRSTEAQLSWSAEAVPLGNRKPQRHGPEQRIFGERIPRDELEWRQIGSGMWARSFIGMSKLLTTTRSGPQEAEVHRRIIRNADTGKLIDDCIPEDVPDDKLYRKLNEKMNIRVQLVMKDASKWFRHSGADISEVYSPPRIAQEAGPRTYGGKL